MEKTVLLSVGEVNKNKNHRVVIEALPSDCYYVICGRGPLMNELKALSEKLGVADRVILTGYRNDVIDFYNMADLFVFPSYREGLPVALIEAISSGLPVVASKIRGCSDLLEEGFEPGIVEDVRRAIEDALMNVSAPQNRISDFDFSNISALMVPLYGDVGGTMEMCRPK